MLNYRHVSCVISAVLTVNLSVLAISGKVVDQGDKPVANAMISYTDLAKRMVWAYSDAQGNFILDSPDGTAVAPRSSAGSVNGLNVQIAGNRVLFTPQSANASVILSDLSGRRIASRSFRNISSRHCAINPFNISSKPLSHATYLVTVKSGTLTTTLRMVNLGTNRSAGTAPLADLPGSMVLAKSVAGSQVRIGKTGYTPALKDYSGFTDNLGTIKINQIDIEAKVDSVINVILNHPKKKNILMGQSIMPPKEEIDLGMTYNCATMMYGANDMMTWNDRLAYSNQAQTKAMVNSADHLPIPLIIVGDNIHGYIYGPEGGIDVPPV